MFKNGLARLGVLAMTLGAVTACHGKKEVGEAFTSSATTSSKVLKNPHNTPEVVLAIQKVLDACSNKWSDKEGFGD